jgi:hypothetical protein
MYQIHLKIDLIPDITSNCDFSFPYEKLQYNLDISLLFKNIKDDSIFKSSLETSLAEVLAGYTFQSKNLFIDKYIGSLQSHFHPVNCSCGYAECAGIFNGVIINKNSKFITWKAQKKSGYLNYLPAIMSFDRKQYISFIIDIRQKLIDLELKTPNMYRISGKTIPEFFKEIAKLQSLVMKCKFKNKSFSVFYFVEEKLNSFHDKNITSLDEYSMKRILQERFYYSLTNNLFTHVDMKF